MTMLLDAGADVNVRNHVGETPLFSAIFSKRIQNVECILNQEQCNVNVKSKFGITPLMCAIEYDCMRPIEMLLARGANVNAQDCNGNTALRYVILNSDDTLQERLILLLLRCGCDKSIQNNEGLTAEMLARSDGCYDIADLLRDYEPFIQQ